MESFRTRLLRWGYNLFPAYRGTGARVVHIERDFREVRIRLPLNWRTRNAVGTIFGGSMYGAVDPVYMIMLRARLGGRFVVWDKAAHIRFRKPGRTTLHARFRVDDEEIAAIHAALLTREKVDRIYHVELTDAAGVVHASIEKVLHVRRRDAAP